MKKKTVTQPKKKTSIKNSNKKEQEIKSKDFSVVAIGASAGGLEAISKLFERLEPKLGMAYVIIQHLAPDHPSILPELIENFTSMPVTQVTNGLPVLPDNIYVIPPNSFVNIEDGHLLLTPRVKTDGSMHPIDFFLSALASVYEANAIAVILSGTATDGTLGVQAIKAEGGITFAQDQSAKFQGMPHSAKDSGYIDFVLSPEEIADELKRLAQAPSTPVLLNDIQKKDGELKKIFTLLNNKFGVDFTNYKQSTIARRILRRMKLNKLDNLEEYTALLHKEIDESSYLYQNLLINVTGFFRDPVFYQTLSKKLFPALIKNRKPSETIRIWITACSTGEEAYSVAMCLFEYLGDRGLPAATSIQIFATDLSEMAIQKARAGIYSKASLNNISPQRLARFFIKLNGSYQIIKPIRDICLFATHNLLKDPPFSKMDIISCQNILIYLELSAQRKILQTLHYALKPMGYLLLGKSESVSSASEWFEQNNKQYRIFTKTDIPSNMHFFNYGVSSLNKKNLKASDLIDEETISPNNIDAEVDKILLNKFVPASVLINKDLQILRFQGATSNYFEPTSGKASLHLLKMVKEELAFELRTLLTKAKKNGAIKKDGIPVTINNLPAKVSIEIVPIKSITQQTHYLVVFKEKAIVPVPLIKELPLKGKANVLNKRISQMETEIGEYKDQIKTITEEFEGTSEELQTANEEILSSNEELQSINEELETSKEELQSTNEELTTINEEVQHRNDELKEVLAYTDAIVQTIREPLVVLTADLRIWTTNQAFQNTFKIKQDEAEGNYFFDIENGQLDVPELRKKLSDIVSKNKSFENFELSYNFKNGVKRILLFNAMRLGNEDKKRKRFLLVIEDITKRRNAENDLMLSHKQNEERLNRLIQNAYDVITIFSKNGDILYSSESIETVLGHTSEERKGKNIFTSELVHPEDKAQKEMMFKKSLLKPGMDIRTEFRMLHSDGTYRTMEAVFINLLSDPLIKGIVANYRDITERKMIEKQKDQFIGIASHELKTPVTSIKAYAQILQQSLSAKVDTQTNELLTRMNAQVDRLAILISDLLDVTKISEGRIDIHNENFDLNKLIKDVCMDLQNTTSKHLIVMDLQPMNKINGDKEKLRRVLLNLISNAIKYSPDAEKIMVNSVTENNQVMVSIQDFGIGIADSIQEKIFERFFRDLDPSINTFPGLGLGLYIAAEIIKKMKGKIWVKSEKFKGSTFFFSLPY